MKKYLFVLLLCASVAVGAFAADVTLDSRFDLTGKDPVGSYFSFKSAAVSVEKDQVDAVTGASRNKATEKWNSLRSDADKNTLFPAGFQSLVKYGVSPAKIFADDRLSAVQGADGTITVQYTHRGTAYLIKTDKSGKLDLLTGEMKLRKIGYVDTKGTVYVSKDFSGDGTVPGIDWAKVWNPATPDGREINAQPTQKTGKIVDDRATSVKGPYVGTVQLTLKGTVLTVKGELNVKKP